MARGRLRWFAPVTSNHMNILIKNLPFSITAQELDALFSLHTEVWRVTVPLDIAGNPRGFGFVETLDKASGWRAIQALDGCVVGGRVLSVMQARARRGP
jgi:RNA recognition motif-containing protein